MKNAISAQRQLKHYGMVYLLGTTVILAMVFLYGARLQAAEPASTGAESTVSRSSAGLPRVIVLATGGTIAGQADPRGANAYNAGGVNAQQLIQAVPGIDKLANLSAEQVASIGSQDMNDKVWFKLARRIQQIFDQHEADAVVVTHGTDTLEETAFFLDNVLATDRPVVLVGAMRPSTATSADGPNNLYDAVKVAASPQALGRGVMVVLNETIQAARWTTKSNTTSVETFRSPNAGPIGYVDHASVRFIGDQNTIFSTKYELPAGDKLPRVEIIYAHSNMDAEQIDAASKDAKGIVLAGVGDGNASKEALAALERAVHKGILVIRSARVGSGFVNRNVEINDDKSGFVVAFDLNPQKARILAQLLIANHVTAPAQVQKAFSAGW